MGTELGRRLIAGMRELHARLRKRSDVRALGFEPLPMDSKQTNAGVRCDMKRGPCACGAWHDDKDTPHAP